MLNKMHSIFIREQKRYTRLELLSLFNCSEDKTVSILKKLKEYGVLKIVNQCEEQKNLTDLLESDVQIASIECGDEEYYYVFTFVGVIIISGFILKCYPKYIFSNKNPTEELRLVIKAIEKYSRTKNEVVRMYNDTNDSSSFNLLAVILFLLNDYSENGSYSNEETIIESNGMGDILWDRTINDTFTLISNNRPYYPELLTKREVDNEFDYFKRLHECILTICSKEIRKTDLSSIFDDINIVDISDEELDDFGDRDYILYKIENELNVQFNTHKQIILKTLYAFISQKSTLNDINCFSMFGSNNFESIWEEACQVILDDKLQSMLGNLKLPKSLKPEYERSLRLIDIIEKPKWKISNSSNAKEANSTLIPDLITFNNETFVILDAKYYVPILEENKKVSGQPGIESITKQYLYQLAYSKFIADHGFLSVKNCFIMPTESSNVIDKGVAYLEILDALGLEQIKVRMIPANDVYTFYITNKKYPITKLGL